MLYVGHGAELAIGQLTREGLFCHVSCDWVPNSGLHVEELFTSISKEPGPSGEQCDQPSTFSV